MDTYLVGASGFQFGFEQGEIRIMFQDIEYGMRLLSGGIDPDPPFAFRGMVFEQRQADMLPPVFPVAMNECLITFVHGAFTDLFMQLRQRGTFFGQYENAGRFLVQPVDEFQKTGIRPHGAQLFDHAERNA